ncbi:MAG: PRD domain-containing protein [Erysipelotrichaceae bacterium]|nr:PRD domain-containing protein [Erysipelotrichaceae bacterium]
MKIEQIINNNTVISKNTQGKEIVIFGKGLGFSGKKGSEINETQIEKIFVLSDEVKMSGFFELLDEIPYDVVAFGLKAYEYILTCTSKPINKRILVPLTDHIYTTLERNKQNLKFENELYWNIRYIYADEYHTAVDIVDMMNSDFNVEIDPKEAAFIALHIVNAEMDIDLKDTYKATDIIDISIKTVEEVFNVQLKEDINFARLMTHLQFFAKRMIQDVVEENEDNDINKFINLKYANEYACAEEIARRIKEKYSYSVDRNELTYLTIHIARLFR